MTADYAADFVETLDTRPIRGEASVAAGLYACGPSAAVVEGARLPRTSSALRAAAPVHA
jgi:hypothetical protein